MGEAVWLKRGAILLRNDMGLVVRSDADLELFALARAVLAEFVDDEGGQRDCASPPALRLLQSRATFRLFRALRDRISLRARSTEHQRRAAISPRRRPQRTASSTGMNMRVPRKWAIRTAVSAASRAHILLRSTFGGSTLSAGLLTIRFQRTAVESACFRIRCMW